MSTALIEMTNERGGNRQLAASHALFRQPTSHGHSIIERPHAIGVGKIPMRQQDLSDCSPISRCPRSACGRSRESREPERPLERRLRKP